MSLKVYYNSVEIPIGHECLVDMGLIGYEPTEAELREALWPTSRLRRVYLTLRYGRWRYELLWRLEHAAKALRGIDCEP